MDLKFKSRKWVGSIYHTFEAICHEVDDFVSQETVKYVENQAQAVGGSVKRFYSNVVQDLLPSSLTQPGKHEAQVPSLEEKGNDETYIRPTIEMQKRTDVDVELDNSSSSGLEIADSEHNKTNIVLEENDVEKTYLEDDPCQPKEIDLCPEDKDLPEASLSSDILKIEPSYDTNVRDIERDDADMKLAFSSSSFDEDIPSADDIAALVGSFEDNNFNDYAHLEALMSSMKVDEEDECMVDISDPSMVNIELSDDEAKLDEKLMENKLIYAVFCRSRKHKSFKKILQDAFASRKRLRKEYQQLGILFGDIDIDPSKRQGYNSLLPEIPSSSLGSEKLSSGDLSEWELL